MNLFRHAATATHPPHGGQALGVAERLRSREPGMEAMRFFAKAKNTGIAP